MNVVGSSVALIRLKLAPFVRLKLMTAFEFFTVLLSFIVSLGVATLLLAVARLIQESQRVQFSLSYTL